MESDTSDKKVPLEDMSKEDIIKKYNNMLIIAKKAKQSKNGNPKFKYEQTFHPMSLQMAIGEAVEEVKKAKESELKLTMEVNALKEIIESFAEKQKQYAEGENKIRQTNEKNIELQRSLTLKMTECNDLENKLSDLQEKLEDFKQNYAKVDIEKKLCQEKLFEFEEKIKESLNLKKQLQEIVSDRSNLVKIIDVKEKELKDIKEQVIQMENANNLPPENFNDLVNENNELKAKLHEAEGKKIQILNELELCKKSETQALTDLNKFKDELENLQIKKSDEITRIKEIDSLKFEELQEKINKLEKNNKELQESLNERDVTPTCSDKREREELLEKEIENLKREKEEAQAVLENQLLDLNRLLKGCQEELKLAIAEKKELEKKFNVEKNFICREGENSSQEILNKELEAKKNELECSIQREKLLCEENKTLNALVKSLKMNSNYENVKNQSSLDIKDQIHKIVQTDYFQNAAEESCRISETLKNEIEEKNALWEEKLGKCNERYNSLLVEKENLEKLLAVEGETIIKEKEEKCKSFVTENENLRARIHELEVKIEELDHSYKVKEKENLSQIVLDFENKKAEIEEKNLKNLKMTTDLLEKEKENRNLLLIEKEKLEKLLIEEKNKFNEMEKKNIEKIEKINIELKEAKEVAKKLSEAKTDTNQEKINLIEENECLRREVNEITKSINESRFLLKRDLEKLMSAFIHVINLKDGCSKEIRHKLNEFQQEQREVRQKIEGVVLRYVGQLHNGNSELLSEMNDMNQVLKERGETISKLEQIAENQRKELEEALSKISHQSMKLVEKNKKLDEMEDEISKAKMEVENKHRAMREMEEEMWRIKNNESLGETLSSSTLSKADEAARLAELEESFEERYLKLKAIAVKLKKKVKEMEKQVEIERNNLMTTESDYQSKVMGFQNQIKGLRNIQTEYDNLQDVLDQEKKEKNLLKKNLELAQQEIISCKQKLEEIKLEKDKFKADKTSFEKIKKELTAHISELKQTIEKQKKDSSQLQKELEDIKNQLLVKDRHIEEEKEKHKAAILLLEEQKLDFKKHSVLELEMAAYEKTAEDLKKRLDNKEKEIKELENRLESEKKARESQEEEINHLKSNVKDEQSKVNNYNDQIKLLKDEIINEKAETQKKTDNIKNLERSMEEKSKQLEDLSLQMKDVTTEKYKNEEEFRNNEEKYCRQIHTLEEKVFSLQEVLNQERMELQELKNEYQAYKVRAQSVLRQSNKEVNTSKQQNVLEELEQLKSTSESLKARLKESSNKLQKISEENSGLQDEKKRLFGRVHELNDVVNELRNENQKLKELKQKENEEHAEALRIQKLQSETLAQCFEKEIQNLEIKHSAEIDELNKNLQEITKQKQSYFKPDVKNADKRKISGSFVPVKPEKEGLDIMLLEREECEGSESVDLISPQTSNNLVPLEQLLNQAEMPDVKKAHQDLVELQSKLEKNENKLKHLTILLADAESDSARLTQLNEVLKEEIKRLQRSLEREKHAQNFEYLKNVIIKFASLQNVDEKLRLVPVLNTILKLSPEEEHTLTNCAKGVYDSGARGWGLNLNIWQN